MSKRDPYPLAVAALWLLALFTALRIWLVWNQLPLRMATHFDDRWRPNGWSSREDAVLLALGILGFGLLLLTPACLVVRARKPGHAWPVLVITYVVMGFLAWGSNAIVSRNLPPVVAVTTSSDAEAAAPRSTDPR